MQNTIKPERAIMNLENVPEVSRHDETLGRNNRHNALNFPRTTKALHERDVQYHAAMVRTPPKGSLLFANVEKSKMQRYPRNTQFASSPPHLLMRAASRARGKLFLPSPLF